MVSTLPRMKLSERDMLVSQLATIIAANNFEQLAAIAKKLDEEYSQEEVKAIWEEINKDFSQPQKAWLYKSLKEMRGEAVKVTVISTKPLTKTEGKRLAQLEAEVDLGMKWFVKTGKALTEIRDNNLYREYGTFEEYVESRWDIKRRHSYQLIDAAQLVEEMCATAHILPESEYVARQLLKIKNPSVRLDIWEELTAENPRPKASDVIRAREKLLSPAAPPPPPNQPLDFAAGELVVINCKSGEEARFDGWWGRIEKITANNRYKVAIAGSSCVFNPDEVDDCNLPEAFVRRIEELVKAGGHAGDIAATYYKYQKLDQWEIELIGFLEKS